MSDYKAMDEIIDYLEPLVGGSDEGVAWMLYLRTFEKQLAQANTKIEELEVREETLIHNAKHYANMTVEHEVKIGRLCEALDQAATDFYYLAHNGKAVYLLDLVKEIKDNE